jgi:hypothetical protein
MRDDERFDDGVPLPSDLARFEARLATLPLPAEPDWNAVAPARVRALPQWPQTLAIAASVLLVLGAGLVWSRGWAVESHGGRAALQGVAFAGRVGVGGSVVTDAATTARLDVPGLGHVMLAPGGCVQRVRGRGAERRLELVRGTLHAEITAPPRLFVVGTSVGTAVDLGCAYTLTVDDTKNGKLEVTHGRVLFENGGLESLVPAGLWCPLGEAGAGVPRRAYASDGFLAAIALTDNMQCQTDDLAAILAQAEASDAISLWHLLPRVQGAARRQVAERMATLIAVPSDVALDRVLALEPAALAAWWDALGVGSYQEWHGPGAGLKAAR